MDWEDALFPEMEQRSIQLEPRGFRDQEEIVTKEEEAALVASLGELNLKPFEFHGHLGNRRVVSFGLKYDYSRRSVEPDSVMPAFLEDLLLRVAEFAGLTWMRFNKWGSMSTDREWESGGTKTSRSLESSSESHSSLRQQCDSGEQMVRAGNASLTR